MEYKIKVYGDNILECERALDLIMEGINFKEGKSKKEFIKGNLFVPTFKIIGKNSYFVTLFPGIKKNRWGINVYEELITGNGGTLSEGADALITVEEILNSNTVEKPVLAIEFSSALPAGNNSWQRSGRALSFSQANIPYIYVTEIGGNELDSNGNIKAIRWPSSALILSYILNTIRKNTINLISYKLSPVSSKELRTEYSFLKDDHSLQKLVYNAITSNDLEECRKEILEIDKIIYNKRAKPEENYFSINNSFDPNKFFNKCDIEKLKWKKKISIPTSESFKKIKELLNNFCYSSYSRDSLPFGTLPKGRIGYFTRDLSKIYPDDQIKELKNFLKNKNKDVIFTLINGFKPKGEDSRPDRGVIPFIKMLFGNEIPIITIIFGPVPKYHLNRFRDGKYSELANSNGLFSTIFTGTDYLIIDTLNNENADSIFIKNDIKNLNIISPSSSNYLKTKLEELPEKFGENDVDTFIHMFFEHGFDDIFESFSNPPGGDWSGISILKNSFEYRWISLPRAPKNINVKRPDHIFQIDSNTLLSIESKDQYKTLIKSEKNVGPNMIAYLEKLLFIRPINAIRKKGEKYFQSYNKNIDVKEIQQLTSVAFISKNDNDISFSSLRELLSFTNTDMVFGIKIISIFDIEIHFYSTNQKITNLLESKTNKVITNFNKVTIINVKN